MQRHVIRQLLILGCLVMLVPAVLAACGGDDDDDTGDSGSTTTEVAESTEQATEDETASATEETTDEATEPADGTSTGTEGTATEAGGTETGGQTGGDMTAENTWEGPIVFADFNWTSAVVHNRIAQYIIEHGFDYETDSTFGDSIPLIQGMMGGDIQVAMEIWIDNYQEIWDTALEEGTLVDLGTNYPESSQGWYIPTYMIEGDEERGIEPMAPDLKSVMDLPEYKDLFEDPANPDKGRFYSGVPGWQITEIIDVKFESYGLNESFNNFQPGSAAALFASLTSAYETGDPWVGYLWSPHWVFAQMDMTELEQPEYTKECWDALIAAIQQGVDDAPDQACDAPSVEVNVAANPEFAEQAPGIVAFLENYETTEEQTNNFLLWMSENEATEEETAIHFLDEHPDIWTSWVTDEIAGKVQEALDSGAGFGDS